MRLSKVLKTSLFVLLALTCLDKLGWAQLTTSRLDGLVRDPTGFVVPGATVILTNVETNASYQTATNESGLYVFPQVPFGLYRVAVEVRDFKKSVVEGVKIEVNVPATVNFNLELGQIGETIEVSATEGREIVNTVNAAISTVVTRDQIQALPLNGRDPLQFALLQAGVTGSGQIAREASVNGTRGTFNNLTLDGINNQDNFIRTDAFFGVIPLRESFVHEFNITTSNAETDGGIGSSQTQLVTRGGTNQYHGTLFYFHRNSALNANRFFNNASGVEKPRVLNHQFGGNAGGPIIRDKLFIFGNYEEERDPAGVSVVRRVLTPSARDGVFSYQRLDNGQFESINLLQLTGVSFDPAIRNLIGSTPQANDSSEGDGRNFSGFRFNSSGKTTGKWLVLRSDYVLSQRNNIEVSFKQFQFDLPNDPFNDIDTPFPGRSGGGQASTRRSGTAAWRATFSPTLINEARWGFQYAPVQFVTNEGFSSGYRLLFPNADGEIITNPVQNSLPQGRKAPVYEVVDNATWIKGNHSVKFGGSFRWSSVNSFNLAGGTLNAGVIPIYQMGFGAGNPNPLQANLFPGGISSADLEGASDLLALLGGYVDEGRQVFNVTSRTSGFVPGARQERTLTQRFFSLYSSDTWRLHPQLTLTAGLRWEYHTVPDEKDGLVLLPVGGVSQLLDPNATIDFAGGDTGRPFFNKDLNNFSPSVALAWRPFGQRQTVLRAGYSINYVIDNNFTAVQNAYSGNDGLTQQVNVPGLSGTVSSGGIQPIPVPPFKVPRSARDNLDLDPFAALYTIDPNLRTPYVQQWTMSLQHELLRGSAFEIRYIGNRGTKLSRALDLNQVQFPADFVEDFRRAQRNLAANGSPTVGEPLQVLPSLGLGGFLQNGTIRNWIRQGQIGTYVGDFLAPNRAFFFAGEGGENFGATLPITGFYPNPNIFIADFLGNNSFSSYHALQTEFRGRIREGLHLQSNYTFGKVLTNFSGTANQFRAYMDNGQQSLEVFRPEYDITHTFNTNFLYDIPFGLNRRFLNSGGVLNGILGGWSVTGIARVRSGETINIVSQRATLNRAGRSIVNTVHLNGLTIPELQDRTGAYRGPNGVTLFAPSLIAESGRASEAFFTNPGLLQAGTLALSPVSGPWYFTADLGLRKSIQLPFSETSRLEFRWDFYNIFNRANFDVGRGGTSSANESLGLFNGHNINSTSFGLINDTFDPREMQFGLRILF
ncbi:MAG: TonB-dependent receptor [Acidobacteriota bacterium]